MTLTLTHSGIPLSFLCNLNEKHRLRSRVLVRSVGNNESRESVVISGVSSVNKKDAYVAECDVGGKKSKQDAPEELEVLWDDGFGTQTTDDGIEIAMNLIKSDGGPPRWFCPMACGKPIKNSPVLLYLPGIDGTGAGLVIHEKTLGKVYNVQCLHIPVWDRTSLEGLIHIVEEIVMIERTLSPNKPIYLLGESFGGALALCVAARNPTVDLILILANPATAYERSPLNFLPSLLEDLPEEYYGIFPYAMSPLVCDYIKMAMIKSYGRNHVESLWQMFAGFCKDLPLISVMLKILPKDTLTWRLKLVQSAAAYANSRLHAITSQVLVLASGRDNILPSKNEAQRLFRILKHCDVRVFEENGHTILLESGVNVLTAIKTTYMYRRSSKHDILKDFLPISITEFKNLPVETWWYHLYIDAVIFSTMENGKIVRGLEGIPDEGPVLIVGNHMLMAFDVFPIVSEFMREKKITLHGLTHPEFFNIDVEREYYIIPLADVLRVGGSIPVSGRNFFKLLAKKSHVLLYPGGLREGLHRKGEAGKLFWPDKQEFVRMAVKFGATIIPFGGVGEDDILELLVDYNDMKRNPLLNHMVNTINQGRTNLREGVGGEIAKQQFHMPLWLPKPPGRLYFKFGKPIRTKGKEDMLNDNDYLQELYLQIKSDVEKNIAYLLEKREEDPYRSNVERILWRMKHGSLDQIPSFEP
ncbi:acyltransferase-like protein At1g54570, chloroplastic isoform X1 [Helianthus annuus]|uniref:acyltransferase-like protein At1g54570, chloroplastic isoform X1 n=1 Tax=Helianthus annuus TaxID=4232 RepID=UPI000B8FF31A|nr:acyltransferase-like protein At1g54570, chloroplastic isoform X1 [Helianthus annuus]